MQQLLERSSSPVLWFSEAGVPVHANPAFCEMAQSTLADVLASGWTRALAPILSEGTDPMEASLPLPDGRRLSVLGHRCSCTGPASGPLTFLVFQTPERRPPPSPEELLAAERLARLVCADLGRQQGEQIGLGITEALRLTGQFAGADRCYVFQLHDDDRLISNTFEWCAPGVEAQMHRLQDIVVPPSSWWVERLRTLEASYLPTLDSLPPEATHEREVLEQQSIQSLVIVPLAESGRPLGFIGLDWVRAEVDLALEEKSLLLRMVGEAISNALNRKQAEAHLREASDLSDALNRVGRATASTLDRDEMLTKAADESARSLGADAVTVILREPEGWILKHASGSLGEHVQGLSPIEAAPLNMLVAQEKRAVFVEDVEREDRRLTTWLRTAGFRACCVLPLLANGSVTGVMGFGFRRPTHFSSQRRAFVGHLTTELSLALEAARLYQAEHYNNQLLRAITSSVPVGMCLVDADTLEMLWGNPAGAQMLPEPFRRLYAPGVNVSELMPGLDLLRLQDIIQTVARTGQRYHGEQVRLPWNGRGESHWEVTVLAIPVARPGRQVLFVGHDVTPMVQSRQRIEELACEAEGRAREVETERARLRAVIESTPEAVVVTDGEGRVTLVNPSAVALGAPLLLGCRAPQTGREATVCDAELSARAYDDLPVVRAARLGDSVAAEDMVLLHADGQRRDLRASSAPILDPRGSGLGAVGVCQDVTDIKAAQRELELLERMKSDLIASASHELRTPLAAVRGYAELMLQGGAGVLSQLQLGFVRVIADSAQRLEHLVNDLLDASQLESHRLNMHLAPSDLGVIIRQAAERARERADEAAIALNLRVEEDLPTLLGDARRLGRVFDSLLDNAVKFSRPGGTISVSVGLSAEGMLEAVVSDTGEGIASEEMPALFDRFFRGRNVTKQGIQGTGLGLYTSRSVVEMHGGAIEAESEVGRGSTFRVRLPTMVD